MSSLLLCITHPFGCNQNGVANYFLLLICPVFDRDKDSIVASAVRAYDHQVELMESLVNCANCPGIDAKQMEASLVELKTRRPEMLNFKYFHLLSQNAAAALNYYFNEYPPYSTIKQIQAGPHNTSDLKHIADTAGETLTASIRAMNS